MKTNPLHLSKEIYSTVIASFPWRGYMELRELDEKHPMVDAFWNDFRNKALYTRMLREFKKLPLAEMFTPDGDPIVDNDGTIITHRFIAFFTDEVYGKYPEVEMTSESAIMFMTMLSENSRSKFFTGSQVHSPEYSSAVPPIMSCYEFPYSAWQKHDGTIGMIAGKDLATAWLREDLMNAALAELKALEEYHGYMVLKAIITPNKFKIWAPKDIPTTYQVLKPKQDKKAITAVSWNALEAFERSMLINAWFFKHDHPKMVVNINNWDSRERMWKEVDDEASAGVSIAGVKSLLGKINTPYVSPDLQEYFKNLEANSGKRKLEDPDAKPKKKIDLSTADSKTPW